MTFNLKINLSKIEWFFIKIIIICVIFIIMIPCPYFDLNQEILINFFLNFLNIIFIKWFQMYQYNFR